MLMKALESGIDQVVKDVSAETMEPPRHCEARSDEAISDRLPRPLRGLAMTGHLEDGPDVSAETRVADEPCISLSRVELSAVFT
jgi:hypothetical protein